jgi:hypothetical protein
MFSTCNFCSRWRTFSFYNVLIFRTLPKCAVLDLSKNMQVENSKEIQGNASDV